MTGDAALPCGCAGKTSLDRVVEPARRRVRTRLAAEGVHLAGDLEAGLLPRRTSLERVSGTVTLSDGDVETPWRDALRDVPDEAWGVAAVLAAPEAGRDVDSFADVLATGYTAPPVGERLRLAKGHSVQVVGTDRTTVALECLRPRGARRPGYVAANVDVVHGFQDLPVETQAAVAGAHALNDCYAYGASTGRALRPLVAVPADADSPSPSTARRWYRRGLPSGVSVLDPMVVRHGGRGWLFGACVIADLDVAPPLHTGRIRPGDGVLLHRPLGAVATLAAARDTDDAALRETAVDHLAADHGDVGDVVAAARPAVGEPFDPERHLSVAVDVSGPGIGGVAAAVARSGHRLHVESVPVVDAEAVDHARRRWLVPDATLGTNGPVAMVGRPAALERVASLLRARGEHPVRLGRVVPDGSDGNTRETPVSSADGVGLTRLVEDASLHREFPERTPVSDDD